jgi:carbamoylphosphate synthase small subunit
LEKGKWVYKNNKNQFHVVAIDYGIKKNILRYFSDFKCKVTVVSCKTSSKEILSLKPNGIFYQMVLETPLQLVNMQSILLKI